MIPFSPPHIDQKIIDEVIDTLKSGWITTGPKTKLFEKKITAYCGNKSTLCLNSATAGLEIMLRWFGVKEGDEVISGPFLVVSKQLKDKDTVVKKDPKKAGGKKEDKPQ